MTFTIQSPPRILFGRGKAALVAEEALRFGARGIVVHGARAGRAEWLLSALRARGSAITTIATAHEPLLDDLTAATMAARAHRPDWVLSLGGGAAIDLGKALAAMIPAPGTALDHLEVVGRGQPLTVDPLPFLALPTTAGTGAEVTRNAVIGLPDHGRKVSLRDDRMIARLAIVDPALTDGCPRAVTLASGLDAVTQVIEPWLSGKATPYSDAIATPAIRPGLEALKRLMQAEDPAARDTLAWVSLSGGLALANSGLGAVHGLAGVIGGMIAAPHGAICGALLGPVLAMNRELTTGATRERVDQVCAIIAAILGGTPREAPARLQDWARDQGLPGLRAMGLDPARHATIGEAALQSSSMKGNPVAPPQGALLSVLDAAG